MATAMRRNVTRAGRRGAQVRPGSTETYGKACDVWSTGVLLYCMLSGEHPFDQVRAALLHAQRRAPLRPGAAWTPQSEAWRRHDGRRAALLSSGERRGPSTARAGLRRARLLRLRGAAQTARVCWGGGGAGRGHLGPVPADHGRRLFLPPRGEGAL